MRTSLIFIFFLILSQTNAQLVSSKESLNDAFAYRVQTMDLFFDRFNFKKNISVMNYIQRKNPDLIFTRPMLIRSLFDGEMLRNNQSNWNNSLAFIKSCTDSLNPLYLHYQDENWYANLTCKIIYNKKISYVKLVLKVETTGNKAFKWSVISASGKILSLNSVSDSIKITNNKMFTNTVRGKYFLSPVSHALEFSEIYKFFEDDKNVMDYVTTKPISLQLKRLITMIADSKIKFISITQIKYYLFQLPEWTVEVKYFNRPSNNSGWLISQLSMMNASEKRKYLDNKLNVTYQ